MPAVGHPSGWWASADPDGEEGDEVASKVREHVSSIRHDGKTVGKVPTYTWLSIIELLIR